MISRSETFSAKKPDLKDINKLRSLGYLSTTTNISKPVSKTCKDPKDSIDLVSMVMNADSILVKEINNPEKKGKEILKNPQFKFLENIVLKGGNELWVFIIVYDYYARAGFYEKAVSIAEKALIMAPNDYRILWDLGRIFLSTKNYQKAIEMFKKARNEIPGDLHLTWEIARLSYKIKDLPQAYAELNDLIKRDVSGKYHTDSLKQLSLVCIQLKKYEEAILLLEKLKKSSKEEADLGWDLAKLYYITKKFDRALKEFHKLLERPLEKKRSALAHLYIGNILSMYRRDYTKALLHYKKALLMEEDPESRQQIEELIKKITDLLNKSKN